jgi:molecular chaperone GrpE
LVARKRDLPASGDQVEDSKVEAPEGANDLESLKRALEEAQETSERHLANWQRAEADFINYKRRTEHERADLAHFANANLISALLPVVDDLERALETAAADPNGATWVEGIQLIYRKLRSILEDHGLTEIEAEGCEFDPNLHEAVMCVEGEEGIVCEEVQKGYRLRDRLLRPSMVKVGKADGEPAPGTGGE